MSVETRKQGIGTRCVHAGYNPGKGEPRQIPVIQSTTFKYQTSEQMGKLFDLEESGYFYSRLQNPTNDHVAAKIANLEGGVAAMLTSSGQAANLIAWLNLCQAGDHIVSAGNIYGGTFNLLGTSLGKLGIEVTFVNPDASEEEISAAIRPQTKLVFGETLSNPGVEVLDIEKFAKIAHSHGVPLIIDNTFATPILCRPFEFGADIVTHSTTKYMDGHGVAVGGAIVDSGNFDWEAHADKFPGLCTPDASYHGLIYTKAFGKNAFIVKATSQLMRDFGAIQSPQNAFYLNLGLQSLHLRIKRHSESALAVARFLAGHPDVAWVKYPGLETDKHHADAVKYLQGGFSGVMCIGLKGDREFSKKFIDSLQLITIETHVADCHSCILHPASHTHRQLTDEQLRAAGIAPELMRLSIGLEDAEDVIEDLRQALEAAHK
ncbi:MAG: O-acetylhomoserine aminocarboxypropyltransferase/cysteine synthase [Bacteroidales bacterium]|nr:O-acetylhomoserine aminocarboxypropyltransferase/cysteine synthase [Bacteroidales bacterium]